MWRVEDAKDEECWREDESRLAGELTMDRLGRERNC